MNSFTHIPVLVAEVLDVLRLRPGGRYVDATIGGGGLAAEILTASGPSGWLLGVDRDGAALKAARERLARFGGRCELRCGTFDRLAEWVEDGSCDGVVFDLGVSSPQLDVAERGFSFQREGPLDMRMDSTQALTAGDFVNTAPEDELGRVLSDFGEVRHAKRLARLMVLERQVKPFTTTRQLAELVERATPRTGRRHPATQVFQALRMAVNDELGQLGRGLAAAGRALREGGRLATITFHSIEARCVKEWGDRMTRPYEVVGPVDVPEFRRDREPEFRWVHRRAIQPGLAERQRNPRARSAQLRVLERERYAA